MAAIPSAPDFSTKAILLRKIEYGDHDYIITFLTQSHGKMSVMAKNAKKSVQRFSGALDLFSLNHIQCAFPKRNKNSMVMLTQAEPENAFVEIRFDLVKVTYASYWCEILYLWMEEGRIQEDLYELLYFCLDMLSRSAIEPGVLSLFFQIRFMAISGFSPNMEGCEQCKTPLDRICEQQLWFDCKEGRIICESCRTMNQRVHSLEEYGILVSRGTVKQLFWMNNAEAARADRIRFSPLALEEGQTLMETFIPFHIGRTMKSLRFLQQLRKRQ
ncbi:MAG: DNA repair protein RecO [Desulfobacterales bacterium]|nr:MAG: DNA repair protein RecO [Desulfobacterales bacterium]